MKTLIAPTEVHAQEVSTTNKWIQIGLQLALNIIGMYVVHLVTLHIWRSMTGH